MFEDDELDRRDEDGEGDGEPPRMDGIEVTFSKVVIGAWA